MIDRLISFWGNPATTPRHLLDAHAFALEAGERGEVEHVEDDDGTIRYMRIG